MEQVTEKILNEVNKVICGKESVVKTMLTAIYAGGHILIEDIPGVGKTTLALAFSKVFGLDFKRIQLTPDTVASDIVGYTAFDRKSESFRYHEGVVMTNILLADEINRTSGKTQSALLEVMEEGNCTVDGVTYEVPKPFSVIATQNPIGSAGTSALPHSQIDRFMIRLKIGFPDHDSLKNMLRERHHKNPLDEVETVCSKSKLEEIRKKCENIFVSEPIYEYVAELTEATNDGTFQFGISPRGAIALCKMAKANAFCEGRDFVIPSDVRSVFKQTCEHRIIAVSRLENSVNTVENQLERILKKVKSPEIEATK